MTNRPAARRTVLAATFAAAIGATAGSPALAAAAGRQSPEGGTPASTTLDFHTWSTPADWRQGAMEGTGVRTEGRPGVVLTHPAGTESYTDPHTGSTRAWDYAVWRSPVYHPATPAGELVASWNAGTPSGTWVRIELLGTYTDGTSTPWYTMGIWAAGDDDIRRTSVDGQSDGKSSVWTDAFAIDDTDGALRLASYQFRVTLYRESGAESTPVVWRLAAMTSDVPDRFEVPESSPGLASGVELPVPPYSQNVHVGRYPEYNNGGQAWCSPTSSQMILGYWGRKPTEEQLAWVNPDYDDPEVCHAARFTYDYQYEGCGNWPFNAAYAATYPDMQGVVTRLDSLTDAEALVRVGIPLITSQSFYEAELDGAGYGTAGHLMTVIGFTDDGDVIANDPASSDNSAVRRVYNRRQFENIWLRTKRHNADGEVAGGSGGVCYIYFPAKPTPTQHRALRRLGLIS